MSKLPTPMPPYILVKVPRKKRDYEGKIIIPESAKFMLFNQQCGEIVGFGSLAKKWFPEIEIGRTLLFHHFVESCNEEEAKEDHLVHQDLEFNYYTVTVKEMAGKANEAYGVWDGEKIIPNSDYIFLKLPPKVAKDVDFEKIKETGELTAPMSVSEGGILQFEQWEESREEKELRQSTLKDEAQNLSRSGNNKPHIQDAIRRKEEEMERISLEINKKQYVPLKVAYHHHSLLQLFGNISCITDQDDIYVLNMAAQTSVKFMDIDYIVAKVNHIGYIIKAQTTA